MTPEGESFAQYLSIVRDAIFAELEGLPDEALNRPLGVPETNTIYASAFHACMSSRDWITVRVGGGTIDRDRDSEFWSTGTLAQLRSAWDETLSLTTETLASLSPADFNEARLLHFNATGEERPGTVRDCLLHVVEHANIHLGHIQLARQLWEHR